MRYTAALAILASVSLLAACSTPYQPEGVAGGYSDSEAGPDIYWVTFSGGGFTSHQKEKDFLVLRCAQLTLEKGDAYFVTFGVNQRNAFTPLSVPGGGVEYIGPHNYVKPGSTALIKIFATRPENIKYVYDAKAVYNSMVAKYKLNLPRADSYKHHE
jgi:hypothetical protein